MAAFFAFAQRAFWAAAIFALAAALIFRFFLFTTTGAIPRAGLPGPRFIVAPPSSCLACSRRAISASISQRMAVRLNLKLLI